MFEKILDKAEKTQIELREAYEVHFQEGERFQKLLFSGKDNLDIKSLARKFGPAVMKFGAASGGGAGVLAILSNIFPSVSGLLGAG